MVESPLGVFSYTRIPQNILFAGVRRQELADGGTFLVAIKSVDWNRARQDVQRFIKPRELSSLDLWTADFFLAQCSKLQTGSSSVK